MWGRRRRWIGRRLRLCVWVAAGVGGGDGCMRLVVDWIGLDFMGNVGCEWSIKMCSTKGNGYVWEKSRTTF